MKAIIFGLCLIIASLLSGCGVTRTHVTLADGTACQATTYTLGKDISGGQFTGCGAQWGVANSDPDAQLAGGLLQFLTALLPLAAKGLGAP